MKKPTTKKTKPKKTTPPKPTTKTKTKKQPTTKPTNPTSRSGRFQQPPAPELTHFTQSVTFDQRLWKQDILGSIAHAQLLHQAHILTKTELNQITHHLKQIGNEIQNGQFQWNPQLEDLHMNIETALTQRTPAGAKLHTARSRNDQIALDIRMWLRDEILHTIHEIQDLQRQLLHLAQKTYPTPIPAYTHLQRAQPVPFAHHLLAYIEMLHRDTQRLTDTFKRTNTCPLGSAALAASTINLNRAHAAKQLGFTDAQGKPQLTQNSMDAVSDRDFAIEYLAAAALTAIHLSRLAEDLILWNTTEFNLIHINDTHTTGSSLMPQKKNPDIPELIRGKTGPIIGNLIALLTTLKALPMTYNRDLQEDKQPLFNTTDTLRPSLRAMTTLLAHTQLNHTNAQKTAQDPTLLATDLLDHLIQNKTPFRQAHHQIGTLIAHTEKTKTPLNQLTPQQHKTHNLPPNTHKTLTLKHALQKRQTIGSPGLRQVKKQLKHWQTKLKK